MLGEGRHTAERLTAGPRTHTRTHAQQQLLLHNTAKLQGLHGLVGWGHSSRFVPDNEASSDAPKSRLSSRESAPHIGPGVSSRLGPPGEPGTFPTPPQISPDYDAVTVLILDDNSLCSQYTRAHTRTLQSLRSLQNDLTIGVSFICNFQGRAAISRGGPKLLKCL